MATPTFSWWSYFRDTASVTPTPDPLGRFDTERQRKGSSHDGSRRSSNRRSWSAREKVWLGEGSGGGAKSDAASRRSMRAGGSASDRGKEEGGRIHLTFQYKCSGNSYTNKLELFCAGTC